MCIASSNRGESGRDEESYLRYHGDVAVVDETLGSLAGRAAERWPDRECVVSLHQDVRFTFAELLGRADRLAAGLTKLGLRVGDRLAVWAPNDVEWMIAFVAATRVGLVAVSVNPAYQQNEIDYCLRKVEAKAVISPDSFKTQDYPAMLLRAKRSCPALEHIIIYSRDHVA